MTIRVLIILLLFTISCSKEVDQNALIGSWKLKDVVDQTGQHTSDRLTFYKNGTATAEVFAQDSLVTKIQANYTFDQQSQTLGLEFSNSVIKYKVEKLNADELDLLDEKQIKSLDIYVQNRTLPLQAGKGIIDIRCCTYP